MSRSFTPTPIHTSPLPTPEKLKKLYPSTPQQEAFQEQARQDVRNILDGDDPRILLIVGPCSIHNIEAARQYAHKLKDLSQKVSDAFVVVMRVYFEKPRTTTGWKGMLYDPSLDGTYDIATGLTIARRFLLDLAALEMPTAAEFLDPNIPHYLGDVITWGAIGARTAASQTHRQMASGLPMPICFKNGTDGNLDVAINGVITARAPHTFIGQGPEGKPSIVNTAGNPHAHLVLRGGIGAPNYYPDTVAKAMDRLKDANLPSRLIIDCSHDNCYKTHARQIVAFQSVINQVLAGNDNIVGAILESHLQEGNQPTVNNPSEVQGDVSLTDPCIDWATTERLILWASRHVRESRPCNIDSTIKG